MLSKSKSCSPDPLYSASQLRPLGRPLSQVRYFFSLRSWLATRWGKHKDRPEAVRYARHALSWQGFGSSRAAGGFALTISDVESGDFVSGLIVFPSPSA